MTLFPVATANAVTRGIGRSTLKFKKESPHIFFVGGVVGVVVSAVLACRATLKLNEVMDEIEKDIHETKHAGEEKTERQYYVDVVHVYGKGLVALVKLYGTSFVIGAVSISALAGSHVSLTRRNTALTGALATVVKAYDEYRDRVREELGKDEEYNLYLGGQQANREARRSKQYVTICQVLR